MTAKNKLTVTEDLDAHLLTFERLVDAPRELVWESWTRPEHLARWWSPAPWTTTIYKMELRPGGSWHYCLRPGGGEGEEVWARAVYQEVVRPSYLTYLEAFSDAGGSMVEDSQRTVKVEFVELEPAKTRLIVRMQFVSLEQMKAMKDRGMVEGFAMTLDQLEALLLK